MKRLALATALLVVVLGVAGARIVLGRGDDSGPVRPGSVTLVGDSLNVGIEPYLGEDLDGWKIAHHNVVGRTGENGLAELERLGRGLAPVVVVSLGTNDPQDDVSSFRRLVDQVMRRVGRNRCVIWATIWRDGPNHAFNDELYAAAGRHPRLEIADWADLISEDRSLLAFDGVHGSPEGYARKAEQVARLAERCQRSLSPSPGEASASSRRSSMPPSQGRGRAEARRRGMPQQSAILY